MLEKHTSSKDFSIAVLSAMLRDGVPARIDGADELRVIFAAENSGYSPEQALDMLRQHRALSHVVGETYRGEQGRKAAWATYRPDLGFVRPWVTYINGRVSLNFATLKQAAEFLASHHGVRILSAAS